MLKANKNLIYLNLLAFSFVALQVSEALQLETRRERIEDTTYITPKGGNDYSGSKSATYKHSEPGEVVDYPTLQGDPSNHDPRSIEDFSAGMVFRDQFQIGPGLGPEMVVLPAGSFVMGSPNSEEGRATDEGPQRRVHIDYQFAIGRFEITFNQWDECMADGGCSWRPQDERRGRGDRAVMNVSWRDAQEYISWLNDRVGLTNEKFQYRLLSEAEWEYAARAGTQTRFPWSDQDDQTSAFAWYVDNSGYRSMQVGGRAPNEFGLYDMQGNVWEWVADCYWREYSDDHPIDGAPFLERTCHLRVSRGGSWIDDPVALRSANRDGFYIEHKTNNLGFRVARTVAD